METLTIETIKARIDSIEDSELLRNHSPSGKYGYYVDLGNGIGCKIQKNSSDAYGEYEYLQLVESSGITPIPYAIKEVKIRDVVRYAIFMEHIEGETLYNVDELSEEEKNTLHCTIEDEAQDKLREYGIRHGDLHKNNIIITNAETGDYKVIDFSPAYIHSASDYDEDCGNSWENSPSEEKEPSSVSEETPVSELKENPEQMQFDFMQNVEKTWIKITYHLVTYTLGHRMLTEVFKNKKLALEQLENSLGYDLQNGLLQNVYEILPVYTHEKFHD